MIKVVQNWFQRTFADAEAVTLSLVILLISVGLYLMGQMLMPLIVSVIIAYFLEGGVSRLKKYKLPSWLSVTIVFILFFGISLFAIFVFVPLLWTQLSNLFQELPTMINRGQELLMNLPDKYPEYVTGDHVDSVIGEFKKMLAEKGQVIITASMASVSGVINLIIYLVLVPLLVFFLLLDKNKIIAWFRGYSPRERGLVNKVWDEVNDQIANYMRGKAIEILIVAVVMYIFFALFGLHYAMLLASALAVSMIIPFIGPAVVAVPIFIIAAMQWGWTSYFAYFSVIYFILVTLDGNVLVPLLFSEAVNLHPVAIIAAILVFGGLWGFWGIFFAIPLATLVSAVLSAWPRFGAEVRN